MSLWVTAEAVELRPDATEADLQIVIRAAYKQVLGNQYVMESERLLSAESMLRNSEVSVRGFVEMVAKSALRKKLFFHEASPYRFVELNCKHLLGRAPLDQAEISEHVQIYNSQGYEAEIDSYITSDEYMCNFGDNIVPYPRSIETQVGFKSSSFTRGFALLRGDAASDRDQEAKLIATVGANLPMEVKLPPVGNGASYGNTSKRYRIAVIKAGTTPVYKQSNLVYEVAYEQMSKKIQNIHKMGSKIVSITEVV